jgi:predicted DNA-binding protein
MEQSVVQMAEVREPEEVGKLQAHVSEVMEAFRDFEIEQSEDYEIAVECLKDIKKQAKKLKAEKELATKPMNGALRQVRSWFAPAEKALQATEDLLKSKIADWTLLQERLSR